VSSAIDVDVSRVSCVAIASVSTSARASRPTRSRLQRAAVGPMIDIRPVAYEWRMCAGWMDEHTTVVHRRKDSIRRSATRRTRMSGEIRVSLIFLVSWNCRVRGSHTDDDKFSSVRGKNLQVDRRTQSTMSSLHTKIACLYT
jgi:hypothetical protein